MYVQTNNDVIQAKHSGSTEEGGIVLYLKIKMQYRK